MFHQDPDKVDVLISGMGPAGLAVAYEAAKAGKTVALIEKRDGNFNRLQRVYIGMGERIYLTSMLLGNPADKSKLPNQDGYHLLQSLGKKTRKNLFNILRTLDQDLLDNLKDNEVQAEEICQQLNLPEHKRKQLIYLLTERPQTIIRDYQDMKLINFAYNPFDKNTAVPQIPIKHIERFLMNRIDDINQKNKRMGKSAPIQILTNSKIKKLNGTTTKTATVVTGHGNNKQQREITFQYVIGADGTKHHLADVVNQTLDESQQFKFNPIPKTAHHSDTHLFAHFILHTPDHKLKLKRDFSIVRTFPQADAGQPLLCFISLDTHSLKTSDEHSVKCTVTAEFPDAGYQPDEGIIQFVKAAMINSEALHLPRDAQIEIEFVGEEKRPTRLSFQSFSTLQLLQANKAVQQIGSHQHFILIGDAYRHPDYRRSHGTGDALNQARMIGQIFLNPHKLQDHTKLCEMRYRGLKQYYEPIEGKQDFTRKLTADTDSMMDSIRSKK